MPAPRASRARTARAPSACEVSSTTVLMQLGPYSVERKLADGGMGSVYLGTGPDGGPVVLKVPHAQDKEAALALADEARAGMRLKHPAIVETLDFFVDRGV